LAIGRALTNIGYHVIVLARRVTPEIETADPQLWSFIPCDLMRTDSLSDVAIKVRERGPIYGLVNNAGIGTSGILSMMSDDAIAAIIAMNVTAPITLTKYLIRMMLVAKVGRVVNISSIAASSGFRGLTAYSASKAAIEGFTRSLAREVGSLGITVNAVAPGFLDTEMTESLTNDQREQIVRRSALQRTATVSDVGNAVTFLMGDQAANITGTVLTVDAGNTA
jgi:3-oxoacyl-[acyl-carrier protein] reductase